MNTQIVFLLAVLTMTITSCSYPLEMMGISNDSSNLSLDLGSSAAALNPDFEAAALRILSRNCSSCHGDTAGSGNVFGLTNVNHLIATGLVVPGHPEQSYLMTVIQTGKMPASGPLSQADQDTLYQWILGGGGGASGPNTPPAPAPAPIPEPKFQYIQSEILIPKCVACHAQGNASGGFKFDTYQGVFAAVNTRTPTNSRIYIQVSGGTMPPRPGTPLSSDQSALILQWIKNGALND
jgi:mono/diheme cytochrome c family protein